MEAEKSEDNVRFEFGLEITKAEKNSDGKRLIGGYASTEDLDKEGETIIQKGLDFSPFLDTGWFNDNHKGGTTEVLGYPLTATLHKGRGWYIIGELLKGFPPADKVWSLAKSLQGTPRNLAFSVEGPVTKRDGGRIVKAKITHVAITSKPVNPKCTWEVLSKSFCSHPESDECIGCDTGCLNKALEAGQGTSPETQTGGSALRSEALEGKVKCKNCRRDDEEEAKKIAKKNAKKSLSDDEVRAFMIDKKGFSPAFADRMVKAVREPKILEHLLRD